MKQHRLNILIEAMKTYQPQYDGVDYVSETIRHIVTLAQLDTPAPPTIANPISDWQDILASQPGSYLRLAMTMDLSLSKGRLPEESDFPASLRGLFTAGYSSVRTLMEAGKTNLAPLPQQSNFLNPADQMFFPTGMSTVPRAIYSLPSDADTDSPNSLEDGTTSDRVANGNGTMHHSHHADLHMADHGFIDAALEMEGLAGEVLASYSMQHDSDQSSSTDADGDGTIFGDEEAVMTDWIGNAWGNEMEDAHKADQETAQTLLDALRESESVPISCGA